MYKRSDGWFIKVKLIDQANHYVYNLICKEISYVYLLFIKRILSIIISYIKSYFKLLNFQNEFKYIIYYIILIWLD